VHRKFGAHTLFGLPLLQTATHVRWGAGLWLGGRMLVRTLAPPFPFGREG
jgi:hypothetical protein